MSLINGEGIIMKALKIFLVLILDLVSFSVILGLATVRKINALEMALMIIAVTVLLYTNLIIFFPEE